MDIQLDDGKGSSAILSRRGSINLGLQRVAITLPDVEFFQQRLRCGMWKSCSEELLSMYGLRLQDQIIEIQINGKVEKFSAKNIWIEIFKAHCSPFAIYYSPSLLQQLQDPSASDFNGKVFENKKKKFH